jgi:putative oxidoreductase
MRFVHTAARAMLGAIFVAGGYRDVTNPDIVAPVAKKVTDRVTPTLQRISPALPSESRQLVQLNGAVHLLGGLLLLTPLRRPAALALAASLVPTTLAGHSFWEHDDPGDRAGQQVHFMKNLSMLGGLLLAATDTEGKPGVRWRAEHLAGHAKRSIKRAAH